MKLGSVSYNVACKLKNLFYFMSLNFQVASIQAYGAFVKIPGYKKNGKVLLLKET